MPVRHRALRPTAAFAAFAAGALVFSGCTSTTMPAADRTSATPAPASSAAASASTSASTDAALTANDAALAAIATAEDETQGIAYELDLDDGLWEVHLAVGDTDTEVRTSADGSVVVSTDSDDTIDSDDRAAVDAAGVTLAAALQAALDEYDLGDVEEISVGDADADGRILWEVSFSDDTDVYVDVADGSVVDVGR